jgi:hypothetical protein
MQYLQAILDFLKYLSFWQWVGLILLVTAFRPLMLFTSTSSSKSKTKLAKPADTGETA